MLCKLLLLCLLALAQIAQAETLCVEYFTEGGSTFADRPTVFAPTNDTTGRIFIGLQSGVIKVVNEITGKVISTLISLPSSQKDESAGLLGMSLHPSFSQNGLFYVFYTCEECEAYCDSDDFCNGLGCNIASHTCNVNKTTGYVNVLREYRITPPTNITADPVPVRTLLSVPFGGFVMGGIVAFNKNDGYLYLSLGDGTTGEDVYGGSPSIDSFNNSQNINRRAGKILQIDVDGSYSPNNIRNYSVPATHATISSVWPEIYAMGFRNPYRGSFDGDDFFVGDVGDTIAEEVNIVVKGGNYGWPRWEGFSPKNLSIVVSDPIFPAMIYEHNQTNYYAHAVVAGFRYHGPISSYQNQFFFADFTGLGYWTATKTGDGTYKYNITNPLNIECATNSTNCSSSGFLWSWGLDSQSNLYLVGGSDITRVVDPSRCSSSSSSSTTRASITNAASTTVRPSSSSASSIKSCWMLFSCFVALLLFLF